MKIGALCATNVNIQHPIVGAPSRAARRQTPSDAVRRARRARAMMIRSRTAPAPACGARRCGRARHSRVAVARSIGDVVDASKPSPLSRRALGAKVAFTCGELIVFPWLTEAATRPRARGDEALRAFSPDWLRSLLPAGRDDAALATARGALERGEEFLANGDAASAVRELARVEGLVPREYKINQRAGLSLSRAYAALGDNDAYLECKSKVWWWGRGLRWPGWYIIGYLSARSVYFDAVKPAEPLAYRALAKGEAALVIPIWIGLLYLLVTYGLPDY